MGASAASAASEEEERMEEEEKAKKEGGRKEGREGGREGGEGRKEGRAEGDALCQNLETLTFQVGKNKLTTRMNFHSIFMCHWMDLFKGNLHSKPLVFTSTYGGQA
jgi:hypothetical protein